MPHFLIILTEIIVRLVLLVITVTGTYYLFKGMKNRHAVWGSLVGLLSLSVAVNLLTPSSYTAKNRITFQHAYTKAERESNQKHAASASESRAKNASERAEASRKLHIKQTTGLSGLKYQVNKSLKHDDVLASYSPVKVLGVDTSKPYFANIQVHSNSESKDTMKSSAVSVVKGIKKMHYHDFNTIKVSYLQDLQDTYGNSDKNVPVMVYTFKPKTIEAINPDNISSTDLTEIANKYINKPVKGEKD